MRKACDVVVIGGGPAGTTLATLVKKYAPSKRVVIVEKDKGPAHQVGESLLPGLVPVLKEMGVFEKVDKAGFPRKLGATYIWGPDREPWENDFNDVNVQAMIERYGTIPEKIEYAWQVRRSEYDEILLTHAEDAGVEVLRGRFATGILEDAGRITGVRVEGPGGPEDIAAEFTADCSGQNGFLSKFRPIRDYNPALKNVAGFAYFRGAKWKYNYTGHPDKTKIFVCTTDCGWFWYIPVDKDLVSVGLVTTVEYMKRTKTTDLRALFEAELRKCGEIWPLLENAVCEKDFEGTGKDFFTHSDWSYLSKAAAGPGWLAAGDAAVFVDPILSSGVTLAHLCAHRAAYTLLTQWKETDPRVKDLLWQGYDAYCRESAAQYLALALFWYGNDRSAPEWWAQARAIQRAWLPVDLSDKGAFITVSAGLTQYYDRLYSTAAVGEEVLTRPEEHPFYAMVMKHVDGQPDAPETVLAGSEVPRLTFPWRPEFYFLPAPEGGRLKPVKRVRFLKHDAEDPLKDAFNPRKAVTRYHIELLGLVDGRRTVAEIGAALEAGGVPPWWARGLARQFLKDLAVQGVLEFGKPAEAPALEAA